MRLLSTLLFLLFGAGVVLAHQVTVRGLVRDEHLGSVLAGATVMLENTTYFTETDEKGAFELTVPSGAYTLLVQQDAYNTGRISLVCDEEAIELDVALTLLTVNLQDVLVKSDRPRSAASSLTLRALDFELRPRNSAQDMLRLVPGVFVAQHAGGGKAEQIFVRGFDCDHGTDITASVDGLPGNMPSHGHGQGYMDLHFLIPEVVRNMEVYKGPYFAEFGDFATAAAVRLNTFDELPNNLVQMEVGSTPSARALSWSRGLMMYQLPVQHTRVSAYVAADFLKSGSYFEQNQALFRRNIFSKATYKFSTLSSVAFQVSGFGSSWDASGQIPERAVKAGLITRFGGIDNSEGGTTQRRDMAVTYRYLDEQNGFEVMAFQSQYGFRLYSNFTFFLDNPLLGDGIEQTDNRLVTGVNGKFSRRHRFGKATFGAGYRADNINNGLFRQQFRSRFEAVREDDIMQQSVSGYIKNEWQVTEKFRAELGLRSDYFLFDVDGSNVSGYHYQRLISPKVNLMYALRRVKLFANAGRGFHSNDARGAVLSPTKHRLPSAWGSELGAEWAYHGVLFSSALWWLDLENELVYIGDAGTTEDKGASRRVGVDISMRSQLTKTLYFDADINLARSTFVHRTFGQALEYEAIVPLAPRLTATGGLTYKSGKGLDAALRVRHLAARPANETGSVMARGYTIFDANATYSIKKYRLGIGIENLLNTNWNEAQFATESRLQDEPNPVEEIHFTPGTPFFVKLTLGYTF